MRLIKEFSTDYGFWPTQLRWEGKFGTGLGWRRVTAPHVTLFYLLDRRYGPEWYR